MESGRGQGVTSDCWLTQLSQLGASLPFLPECAVQRGPVDDHLEGEGLGTAEPSLEGIM